MNDEIFGLLITQIWQVSALILIVWAATGLFARDRPHLAHSLWVLVLIKCITPPIWSSPVSPFSWMASPDSAKTEHIAMVDPEIQSNDSAQNPVLHPPIVVVARPEAEINQFHPDPRAEHTSAAPTYVMDQSFSNKTGQTRTFQWSSVMILIWIAGVGLGLIVTGVRFLLFVVWVRRSVIKNDQRLDAEVARLSRKIGIRRRVRLSVLERPVGPAVIGLIRPTILIPSSIVSGKSFAQLEPLLAHELIHIRRGDLGWAMVQTVAKNLFWFHPLVWFAAAMVTRESERSCDEETVACLGCKPATYARGLLDVLEHKHRLRVAPAVPGVRPVDITSARLERVMKMGNGMNQRTPLWVWLVMLVCGTVVLPGAALALTQAEEQVQQGDNTIQATESRMLVEKPAGVTRLPVIAKPEQDKHWMFQTFEVGDLLTKLREANLKTHPPEKRLILELPCRYPGDDSASSTPLGRDIRFLTDQGEVHLGGSQPTMKVLNNKLHVYDTKKQLEQVKSLLKSFKENGFKQIVAEVRFLSVPRDELTKLGVEWSVAQSANEKIVTDVGLIESSGGSVAFAPDKDGNTLIQDRSVLPPLSNESASASKVSAASYIEKSSPVIYALVEEKEVQNILSVVNGNARSRVLQAPSVVMYDGQTAEIQDGSESPFVVGLNRVSDPQGRLPDGLQPVIRLVSEGSRVFLKAKSNADDSVSLDCRVRFSKLLSVDTAELPIAGKSETRSIQIPEVSTVQIRSTLDVPQGKTLVLGSFREGDKGEKEAFLVVVECRTVIAESPGKILEPSSVKPKNASQLRDDPALPPANDNQSDQALPGSVSVNPPGPKQPDYDMRLILNSQEKRQVDSKSQPLVDALQQMGVDVEVSGNVRYELTQESILIQGKKLLMSTGDSQDDINIRGNEGEIEIKRGRAKQLIQMQFDGDVQFDFAGLEMTAENVNFRVKNGQQSTIQVQLIGAAKLFSAEVELSADKIGLGFDENEVTVLTGNAHLIRKRKHGAPTEIQADQIDWNPVTDFIKASGISDLEVGDKLGANPPPKINDVGAIADAIARDPVSLGVRRALEEFDQQLLKTRERR